MSWYDIFEYFDRIGSKLIGLKLVGSSISPDLWIDIIIKCYHCFGNTYVTIDVLIINLMYGIVTIRLSLICWKINLIMPSWQCSLVSIYLILHLPLVRVGNSTTRTFSWSVDVFFHNDVKQRHQTNQIHWSDASVSRRCAVSPLLLQKSCWRCSHLWWGYGNCICFASIFQVDLVGSSVLRIFSSIIECFTIMLHFWFFNQLTNDHFLSFVFYFLLQFGIIIHDWLVFMTQDIFLIDFILYGFCYPSSRWPFCYFTSNGAQESRASKKLSVRICTWVSTLSVSYIRFSWLESCISWIWNFSGE